MSDVSRRSMLVAAAVMVWVAAPGLSAQEVLLRMQVVSAPHLRIVGETGELTGVEIPVPPGTESVPVEVELVVTTRLEPCFSSDVACEERYSFDCGDGLDNNGDGKADLDDPGCTGVQGWSASVVTDPCFHLGPGDGPISGRGATARGTYGDEDAFPPGLVDTLGGGSSTVGVVDPAENGGQTGIVSHAVLSLSNFVTLPPVGDFPICKIRGTLDVRGLRPGERSEPCLLDLRGPLDEGLLLSGAGPFVAGTTVRGQPLPPAVRDLELVVAMEPEAGIGLEMRVVSPAARPLKETAGLSRVEVTAPAEAQSVPVEIDVIAVSRLEPCLSSPAECEENFRIAADGGGFINGCSDRQDNDGDGKIDLADPGCTGIQGYSFSVITDACLVLGPNTGDHALRGVTLHGTYGDQDTRPPGLVDTVGGSLWMVGIVDPARNEGRTGVVCSVVLSFMNFVVLPPVADSPILKIRGRLDATGLGPGERTEPCRLDLVSPFEQGLALTGEPVNTLVTVGGQSVLPRVRDLDVVVAGAVDSDFRRGRVNGDSAFDLSDGLHILNFLFLGGRRPTCLDSADADDDGTLQITDGIRVFGFLFFGFAPIASPGPYTCGPDPTPDRLSCESFLDC